MEYYNINQENELNKEPYKLMSDAWKNWILENRELGIDKQTIVKILQKEHFDPDEIEKEFQIMIL